jgi:hypothetical protein
MSPTTYLDQDALIYLFEESSKSSTFREKLDNSITDGKMTIVLSPWHWVETARTKDLTKALPLAEFMDSLRPVWLRDRRDLETIEVESEFFKFAGVPYEPQSTLITRAELLTALNRTYVSNERAPSSREFVEGWIRTPQLMDPLVSSHQKNAAALVSIRSALASGKLTANRKKEGDRKLMEGFLPQVTPNGVVLDSGTKSAFLNTMTPNDFPTLAIEAEIAEHSWAGQGRVDWNSMVDKFHLISSLPYVDVVVSNDRYLYLLLSVAQKTKFVKASLMKFHEFCAAFVS